MPRLIPRRLAVSVIVFCLALTVIALGAAAKHSQFEKAAHGTSYLTQSVKMVSGSQTESAALPPLVAPQHLGLLEPLARLRGALLISTFQVPQYGLTVALPLLV